MTPRSPVPPARRIAGFSLIELLVALVVVSLGIGGILLGQARGYAALNGTGFRSQAALLAEHLIDRARANPTEPYVVGTGSVSAGSSTSSRDIATWKTQLARSLPSGDGQVTTTITNDPVTGRSYEQLNVVVGWDDRRVGADDTGSVQMRYMLIQGFRAVP